jgi:hypothetical protein
MRIIVCTKRIINRLFGRPKNLLPLKVWSMIRKGRFDHVILLVARSLNRWDLFNSNSFLSCP